MNDDGNGAEINWLEVVAAQLQGSGKYPQAVLEGLGKGASEDVLRWAAIGYYHEQLEAASATLEMLKRQPGRPKKHPLRSIDAHRAFSCFLVAHWLWSTHRGQPLRFNEAIEIPHSTEELAILCKKFGFAGFSSALHFPTVLSSVSRGKKLLQIDGQWRSSICEKLYASLPQMPM